MKTVRALVLVALAWTLFWLGWSSYLVLVALRSPLWFAPVVPNLVLSFLGWRRLRALEALQKRLDA